MRHKRLLWQLYPYLLTVALASIVAASLLAFHALRHFHIRQTTGNLETQARIAAVAFADMATGTSWNEISKRLGTGIDSRITFMLPDGTVVGDSQGDPHIMDNHRERPEMAAALKGQVGISRRYSATLRRGLMYVAVPAVRDGEIIGVVRAALPLLTMQKTLAVLRHQMAIGCLFLIILAGVAALALSRRLSRPLEEMKRAAQRFAQGDLSGRVPVPRSDELAGLASAMNLLAAQLGDKLNLLEQQQNEQEVVFRSMVEGVVAVDADERVININPAAAELFGIQMTAARGRSLQEVIRNSSLQRFFARVLTENRPMEEDIVLHNAGERRLQAHGTLLKDAAGGRIGALVVLNDVTRLHRLEDMRKEFVANVSHELKTPITSIKGFVETLQDGAVGNRDEAQRFLSIISRQAARLESITEDLLSLSRIEQETERTETPRSLESIAGIVANAVQQCRLKIDEKRIEIVVECSDNLAAHVNAPLLEQAMVNLLDNAVKYSAAETSVRISAREDGNDVVLAVQDNGCGIPPEHLPRIFERFYRVDKARSRQLGGTGLGLSIVKHIVQAHGGRVHAESRVGRGSSFTVVLPRTAQDGVVVDAHA